MGSRRRLRNQHRNKYVNDGRNDGRRIPILGSNGAPTKLNLSVQYSPGPLATPVVLPPVNLDGGFISPAFGGATRMETVASRILTGAMDWEELDRCAADSSFRRRLIEAAVITAWELIGYASEFRGLPPENPPTDNCEAASPENQEPERPSGIVLPD
jgi:hypothetical protein